ncbi:MAG: WG repeat-containing protein [Bacteroidia bacterium]|nr:WG repeat-containing protein [Bacteroidia bacterium]MCF8426472.1 WG repeat-containing protein [Bacteroidia bacterium]MCF8448113.1 WG repeat-containing protein [Bacteroidia bacterium]
MKHLLSLTLVLFTITANSQNVVRIDQKGGKFGYSVFDKKDDLQFKVEPIYDYVAVPVEAKIGDIFLGEFYYDIKLCCDTEYMEVPIDFNDPTKTIVDTIVIDKKPLKENWLVMAKKGNSWGLIDLKGNVVLAFNYDSISVLNNRHASENSPLLVLHKNNRISLVNQKAELVLQSEVFEKYYPKLTVKEQVAVLEIAMFNNQLLIQKGGRFRETHFEGGEFNVLIIKQNNTLFGKWQSKLLLRITALEEKGEPVSINPQNDRSVAKGTQFIYSTKGPIQVDYEPEMK